MPFSLRFDATMLLSLIITLRDAAALLLMMMPPDAMIRHASFRYARC